jgi:hypothetical protein
MNQANEVGTSPPRGRRRVPHEAAEARLTEALGTPARPSDEVTVHDSPATCPACGSSDVLWGCDSSHQNRPREEIHPLVWHETERMADSFLCRACDAGWIEPDEPEPITWVRPYWRIG